MTIKWIAACLLALATTAMADETVLDTDMKPAGGICASNMQICTDTANSIMLLNNENLSIRAICKGYDTRVCSASHPYHIETSFKALN
jgi:hypothetical protein